MAVIRYFAVMPSDIANPGNDGRLLDHGETFAEFTTMFYGDTELFIGHDFVYENDELIAGTTTEMAYRTSGVDFFRATGLEGDIALGPVDMTGGDDVVIGSRADDNLFAGDGDDSIWGGVGDNYIRGELGSDMMRGGAGSDAFIFSPDNGIDKVMDFDLVGASQDRVIVRLPHKNYEFEIEQAGQNVVFDFGDEGKVVLRHIDLEDFSKDKLEVVW